MSINLADALRHGVRALLAKPAFTLAAVLTLALGIGANAAIFRVIDALLLRPLPYAQSERLVTVYDAMPKIGEDDDGSNVPDYLEQREQIAALADIAIYKPASFNLAQNGAPERLRGLLATPSLFSTLSASPLLGRAFTDAETTAGNDHVAVLSYETWQTRFAGDAAIVGKDVRLNGSDYRILGVMPQGFFFPTGNVQLWVPYTITAQQRTDWGRHHADVDSVARLKPGVSVAQIEAEFAAMVARNAEVSAELRADYEHTGFSVHARSLHEEWFGSLRTSLVLLQAVVAMLLLITCANVANLLLMRMSARQKEFALRSALGATRWRMSLQLFVETALLALAGATLGLLISQLTAPLMSWFGLGGILKRHSVDIGIDLSTLGFATMIAMFTAIVLAALVQLALRRTRPFELLSAGGRASGGGQGARRTRNTLIVVQLALAVTLLTAAGLLLKSFHQLSNTNPGFSTDVLTARIDLPHARYADPATGAHYYERLLDSVRAVPGVQSVAYTSSLPFSGHLGTSGYDVEGYAGADAESLEAQRQGIDENYFSALAMPLIEGRAFSATDNAQSTPVVIVDELLAQRFWPGASALGHRLRVGDAPWMTIVGVVPSVHHRNLADAPAQVAMYWPFRQHSTDFGFVVIKSTQRAGVLAPQLREAALKVDAELPLYDIQTLDDRIATSLDQRRAPMLLLLVFAAIALVLSAIGIYGVLAFSMAQRTGELGVRMAIGAHKRDILRLALGSGLRLIGYGIGLGLVGAGALGQLMRAQLFGIGAADPVVFIGVIALLGSVALVACWLPARRAANLDPIVALRYE